MTRTIYYNQMHKLAEEIRGKYNISGSRLLPSVIKKILKEEGIKEVVKWPHFKNIRGAYLIEDSKPIIVVDGKLPRDPYTFTLAHELKHHLVDSSDISSIYCSKNNENAMIEIGAEIFAAELLYPTQLFLIDFNELKTDSKFKKTPELIVQLKVETDTTLSYAGLAKRVEFLKLAPQGSLKDIRWKKLQEKLYGIPVYKRLQKSNKNKVS